LNRLPWRLDPLNGTTGFTYEANGNLLSVTDARSNATTYAYVNMDRLATRVDLLTRSESYQHDLAGDMTQLMDRKSKATKAWQEGRRSEESVVGAGSGDGIRGDI